VWEWAQLAFRVTSTGKWSLTAKAWVWGESRKVAELIWTSHCCRGRLGHQHSAPTPKSRACPKTLTLRGCIWGRAGAGPPLGCTLGNREPTRAPRRGVRLNPGARRLVCPSPSLTSLFWRWKAAWKLLTVAEPELMSWRSAVPQATMLPGHHGGVSARRSPRSQPLPPATAPTGRRRSRCCLRRWCQRCRG